MGHQIKRLKYDYSAWFTDNRIIDCKAAASFIYSDNTLNLQKKNGSPATKEKNRYAKSCADCHLGRGLLGTLRFGSQ